MMQVLSEEESLKLYQKTDKWLLELDWNTKFRIRALLDPFYQQTNCEHEWIDPNTYLNELDKTKEFCSKCYLTKPIDK